MNEQDWLIHFLGNEDMAGEVSALGDFLWANGYFDFWDIYQPKSCTRQPAADGGSCRSYVNSLDLGSLRALIACEFREITHWHEHLPPQSRPYFADAFNRLVELEARRPTLAQLWQTSCREIPPEKGIYRIMTPDNGAACFLPAPINPRGHTYDAQELSRRYNTLHSRNLLYIGRADGEGGLQAHLQRYVTGGFGDSRPARGGRIVWQVADPGRLVVEVETCRDCAARQRALLTAYLKKNGAYPVANRRG